jgi:hypothetical protein
LEQQRAAFEQKQRLFENRMNFQQQHLEKLRHELDVSQRGFRAEQQHLRQRQTQRETELELRAGQLRHVRELIQLREDSCARESQLIAVGRETLRRELETGRRELAIERESWRLERQSQEAEIRRQQDLLGAHSENLEARRKRLDQLRTEMEETHHTTLELRMAVEEAFAQLVQAVGDDGANSRVDQARDELATHFRQMRDTLIRQHEDVAESRRGLQRQSADLLAERQQLAETLLQTEQRLREREQQLLRDTREASRERAELAELKAHEVQERLEAEHVIRDLLRQINELSDAAF